jgi:metallophosphoesterase superfamily enzyme
VNGAHETTIAGETVRLLPQRGLYWPAEGTLFVADIHLGKSQTLRAAGAPIPAGVMGETLDRLGSMIDAVNAER